MRLPSDISSWRAIDQGKDCATTVDGCVETRSVYLVRKFAGTQEFRRKYCLPGPPYGHCVRFPAIDVIRTDGALDDGTPDVAVLHRGELVAVRTSTGVELRGFRASALRWVAPVFLTAWLVLVAVAGVITARQRRQAGWKWFSKEGPAAPVGGRMVGLAAVWFLVGAFDIWVYQLLGATTAIVVALLGVGAVTSAILWVFALERRRAEVARSRGG